MSTRRAQTLAVQPVAAGVAALSLFVAMMSYGALAACAQGEPPAKLTKPEAVIPPGQEELLADMLGRGATLPGECKFNGVEADHAIISTTYSCPSGEVVFELRHPSEAARGATRTERFGMTVKSGTPPAGLTDALAALIRSHETKFEWKWVGVMEGGPPASRRIVPVAAAAFVVVVGLWLILRRRSAA
jgi:hypothetical protein